VTNVFFFLQTIVGPHIELNTCNTGCTKLTIQICLHFSYTLRFVYLYLGYVRYELTFHTVKLMT